MNLISRESMDSPDNKPNKRRLAKNILLLYIRMAVTMLVQLYTSRIILSILGIDDFGLWNLVASIVISASFISAPLVIATQRFISFEIGKGNKNGVSLIFSQSMIIYVIISIIIVILLETVGLWVLNKKLVIPSDSTHIANIIYQLSIIAFIVSLLRTPFDATIIAYEKMDFYAYMSIADVVLKLGIVFILLVITQIPHLILYSILTLSVNLLIFFIYLAYCHCKYPEETRLRFKPDKEILKTEASFSGWSLLGSFSVMTANQGVGMLLNTFFGVAINATVGLTNQISNSLNQFISNFQTAFNPQIVKSFASEQVTQFSSLILTCCRISFCLMLLIGIPIFFNIESILTFWLTTVPDYLTIFCRITLLYMVIDALSSPIYIGIYASGNIRNYQIIISLCFFLILPISYILLLLGYKPYYVLYVRVIISVISLFIRINYANIIVNRTFKKSFLKLIQDLMPLMITCCLLPVIIYNFSSLPWYYLSLLDFLWVSIGILFIGLKHSERQHIISIITKTLSIK